MPPVEQLRPAASARQIVLVAARDEVDRIGETVAALRRALPKAAIVVADDGSGDETSLVAMRAGAEVVARGRPHGKGGAMTAACESVVAQTERADPPVFVVCDADLGRSAGSLVALVDAVERGQCDLAVAAFARKQGGGFGIAVGFARWAVRSLTGLEPSAPISGQRAMRAEVLQAVLPFAHGFGMEIGMTIDAARAGFRVEEVELELEHRATGRTVRGFLHRSRQLIDFVRAYITRRR